MKYFAAILLLLVTSLDARTLGTCYGPLEVEEQVLLDLIDSPAVQRLKDVRQYGVCYYALDREIYDRYQHSVGVMAVLRMNGASLNEQIAGLLHDASHTAFSHLGDFFFDHMSETESYQDSIHSWHLEQSGIGEVLAKHGLSVDLICHKSGDYLALEQHLPDMCADRLDYNLQGAYRRGWITQDQLKAALATWSFDGEKWICSDAKSAAATGHYSLYMTENCWGSASNALLNGWLAEALVRGCETGVTSLKEVQFGTDEVIWQKLKASSDPYIVDRIDRITHCNDYYRETKSGGKRITSKFRGVNPWIKVGDKLRRLTDVDPEYAAEYKRVRNRVKSGWLVQELAKPKLHDYAVPAPVAQL